MCRANPASPGSLGHGCEPRSCTAVAENAASCPLGQGATGLQRGAQVPTGVSWAWGSEYRTEGGENAVWLSSAQNTRLDFTTGCRARAAQSQCKCWLVLKEESCSWPHLAMLCHHLPDASSDVRVVGQGRGSENREEGYFYHGVFQLDLVPDLHTRERLPARSHERDTDLPSHTSALL